MKPVKMMRKAIQDHVNAGSNKDYKWTASKEGLHWSYLDVNFKFAYNKEYREASFTSEDTGHATVMPLVPTGCEWLCDEEHLFGKDEDDCIYWAARLTMKYAEYVF